MSQLKIINLASEIRDLNAKKDDLKNQLAKINGRIDEIRFTELPDAMDGAGVESMRVSDIGTVYLVDDLNTSILNKPKAYEWLTENGYGDLIVDYVFAQSLKALVKEQTKKGVQFPEELFKVTPFTRAQIKRN